MTPALPLRCLASLLILLIPAFSWGDTGYVFENVRVLPMSGGSEQSMQTVSDQRVVVTGERIVSVGPPGGSVPPGHKLINAAGKTLMPGLADMHVHYWREDLGPLFLANGITTVRNLWGTQQTARLDEGARRGAFIGPRVYSSGPLMDGPEPIWGDNSVVLTDPVQAVGAVESQKKSGYRAVKLYEGLTPEIYRAAVKAAKKRDMQVWSHTPHGMNVNDLIDLRIDSLEHFNDVQDLLRGERRPTDWFEEWAWAEEGMMPALAARFAEAGVWNAPTFGVIAERYRYGADPEAFFKRSETAYLSTSLTDWWRESAGRMKPYGETARAARRQQLNFLKALYDANAPLLLGTDTPNPFVLPGYAIHDEIAAFVEAGIPLHRVLHIATAEAARFLGETGQWGVVAPRARADLLLLDGDPLQDPGVMKNPVGVMIGGRWITRAELLQALADVAAGHRQP